MKILQSVSENSLKSKLKRENFTIIRFPKVIISPEAFNHLFNSFLLVKNMFRFSRKTFSQQSRNERKDANKGNFPQKEFSFDAFFCLNSCGFTCVTIKSEQFQHRPEFTWKDCAMTLQFEANPLCNLLSKQIFPTTRFSTSTIIILDNKRHKTHNPWKFDIYFASDLLKHWIIFVCVHCCHPRWKELSEERKKIEHTKFDDIELTLTAIFD